MNFPLRVAQPDDWHELAALDHASFLHPWKPQTWRNTLDDAKYVVLVAHCADVLCAFGVAYTVGDEGEIGTLAVAETVRGQGLGETIFRALLEECSRRGARKMYLEVRESNSSARRLYARLGFHTVGERLDYYENGETAIIMCKVEILASE